MIEHTVNIPTKDGASTTFIVHPKRDVPAPVILFFMDALGIREELRDMARRLAAAGYYVMLPNLYARSGVLELADLPPLPETEAWQRIADLRGSLTVSAVMEDADAMLAYANHDPAASMGAMGVIGYCMSGSYAINFAARHPERVAAAASIYGVDLVTDQPDSPHLVARKAAGELYFACAGDDRWVAPEIPETLKRFFGTHKVHAEVELYDGAGHGFAFPDRPAYDKDAAERHWEQVFSLYQRKLR